MAFQLAPLWGVAGASAFLGEQPSVWEWFGGALLLSAVLAFPWITRTEADEVIVGPGQT